MLLKIIILNIIEFQNFIIKKIIIFKFNKKNEKVKFIKINY